MMRFEHEITYDSAPDKVHAMLADPAFRERVCEAVRAFRHDVSVEPHGAGMSVVVDQTQPSQGIPSFAKKIVGEDIRIVQREEWDGESRASLTIEIPGKPGRLDGGITLAPASGGTGSVETVSGDVTVKVPLVGGRLEQLVGDLLHKALKAEQRIGRAWLAGDR
jgi:uncharacterized protein YndB with AHSA1/START domain